MARGYRGRWAELRTVQKVEFIVEIVFWSLFIGSFAYSSYRGGHVLGLILAFGVVWVVLGGVLLLDDSLSLMTRERNPNKSRLRSSSGS